MGGRLGFGFLLPHWGCERRSQMDARVCSSRALGVQAGWDRAEHPLCSLTSPGWLGASSCDCVGRGVPSIAVSLSFKGSLLPCCCLTVGI